jgi:hypothetical protein
MAAAGLILVDLPRSLKRGVERRLPRTRKFKDLTGKKYNRCVVLGFAGYKGPFAAWLCRCKCGTQFVRAGAALEQGARTGCGCFRNPSPVPEPIRAIYWSILARCDDRRHESYHLYGKLGIRVCKRWRSSVELFAKDMGKRPSAKHYVVRKDRRRDFTPANCRWALNRDTSHSKARDYVPRKDAVAKCLGERTGHPAQCHVAPSQQMPGERLGLIVGSRGPNPSARADGRAAALAIRCSRCDPIELSLPCFLFRAFFGLRALLGRFCFRFLRGLFSGRFGRFLPQPSKRGRRAGYRLERLHRRTFADLLAYRLSRSRHRPFSSRRLLPDYRPGNAAGDRPHRPANHRPHHGTRNATNCLFGNRDVLFGRGIR